jgi:hypothetical protein
MCVDWLTRVSMPEFLDLAGLNEQAAAVRAIAPIIDLQSAELAKPVADAAARVAFARDAIPWAAIPWAAARRDAARRDAARRAAARRDAATWAAAVSRIRESSFDLLERMVSA